MRDHLKIIPYFDQLDAMALLAGVDLKAAFVEAGVPTSTYYRSLYGADLRVDTANKVAGQIRLHLSRDKRKHDGHRPPADRAIPCPA